MPEEETQGKKGQLWWKYSGHDYKMGQVVRLLKYWPSAQQWSYDRPDLPGKGIFDLKPDGRAVSRGVGPEGHPELWKRASEYDYATANKMYNLLLFDDKATWKEVTYDLKDKVRAVIPDSPIKVSFVNLGDPTDTYDTIDINLKQNEIFTITGTVEGMPGFFRTDKHWALAPDFLVRGMQNGWFSPQISAQLDEYRLETDPVGRLFYMHNDDKPITVESEHGDKFHYLWWPPVKEGFWGQGPQEEGKPVQMKKDKWAAYLRDGTIRPRSDLENADRAADSEGGPLVPGDRVSIVGQSPDEVWKVVDVGYNADIRLNFAQIDEDKAWYFDEGETRTGKSVMGRGEIWYPSRRLTYVDHPKFDTTKETPHEPAPTADDIPGTGNPEKATAAKVKEVEEERPPPKYGDSMWYKHPFSSNDPGEWVWLMGESGETTKGEEYEYDLMFRSVLLNGPNVNDWPMEKLQRETVYESALDLWFAQGKFQPTSAFKGWEPPPEELATAVSDVEESESEGEDAPILPELTKAEAMKAAVEALTGPTDGGLKGGGKFVNLVQSESEEETPYFNFNIGDTFRIVENDEVMVIIERGKESGEDALYTLKTHFNHLPSLGPEGDRERESHATTEKHTGAWLMDVLERGLWEDATRYHTRTLELITKETTYAPLPSGESAARQKWHKQQAFLKRKAATATDNGPLILLGLAAAAAVAYGYS